MINRYLHWHGLVHFSKIKRESWRRQVKRKGVQLSSRKDTFKKIHCLDHVVGVLTYLACDQGQIKTRREEDGVVSLPLAHTHYARHPISDYHRHFRGKVCEEVRSGISRLLSKYIDFSKKENWTWLNLHDAKTCKCARGDIGRKKIRNANEKRRAFYKAVKAMAVKKAYKEKVAKKRQMIKQFSELQLTSKASLQLETNQNLIKLLD